jgi:hypothetical protein
LLPGPIAFVLILILGAGFRDAPGQTARALEVIRDLRVYLDFDDDTATFASWPVDKFGAKLPADQIARGARVGLSIWASVLPDMRFRFAARPEDANLIFRFGPYLQAQSQGRDGWAMAFLPTGWAERAAPDCGRIRERRRPDGRECLEWTNNIITFNTGRWAVAGADFMSNGRYHEYFSWAFDRRNPHFRASEDGPCVDGSAAAAVWSDRCVPFEQGPHHAEIAGVDLVALVAHEFGHTLLGHHTQEPPGGSYIDYHRREAVDSLRCVRLGPLGYSILFQGDEDKWWNRRGAFPADMERLRSMGYRVNYPATDWNLVLRRRDGTELRTRDWSRALRGMIWPRQATPLSRRQEAKMFFLVDLERNRTP